MTYSSRMRGKRMRRARRMRCMTATSPMCCARSWSPAAELRRMRSKSLVNALAEGGEEFEGGAAAGDLLEEEKAGDGEEDVGAPDAERGRELALSREGDAHGGEEVVDEDEAEGGDEAGAFAAALGGEAERDADEHEDEAGGGVRRSGC